MEPVGELEQYRLLTDPNGRPAPMVLWRPMQRLVGSMEKVVASACAMLAEDDKTSWRVVWLTDTHVAYGHASKVQVGLWTAHSTDPRADDVSVRLWSLNEVRSVHSTTLAVSKHGDGWLWTEGYEAEFHDGSIPFPLFENHAGGPAAHRSALDLLAELTARL